MTTLTEASGFTRRALRVGGFLAAGVTGILITLAIGNTIKENFFPSPPPSPTVAFEKLPDTDLSQAAKPPKTTYILETITGNLPTNLPAYSKVFTVAPDRHLFGDLARTREKAAQIGFEGEPALLADTIVKFTDEKKAHRTLTIETASGNFKLESDFLNDPEIKSTRAPIEEEARKKARDFFQDLGLTNTDFTDDTIELLKITEGKLIGATGLFEANLIRVNFKRQDLDKIPVFQAQKGVSQIWALVGGSEVVAAQMETASVQKYKFATYPLKPITVAFEDLKAGLAGLDQKPVSDNFIIKDVTLGYVEPALSDQYLSPVYVFHSPQGLRAFVPAVGKEWIR